MPLSISSSEDALAFIQSLLENRIVQSAIIVLAAVISDKLLNRRLLKFISRRMQDKNEDHAVRYKTLLSVLSKIVTVVIAFIAVLLVLQLLFDVQPASLIAATGIAGAALGLGAQSLVKDSINGFFILVEDQFSVGDIVTIDGFLGKIHSVSLRMTCVESFEGDRMFISNSAITRVVNHSKENRTIFLDVPISYDADIDRVLEQFGEITEVLKEKLDCLSGEPQLLGVGDFNVSSVSVKLMIPCEPQSQYQCRRDALKIIREEMSARGIEIPYEHLTVIHKGESN